MSVCEWRCRVCGAVSAEKDDVDSLRSDLARERAAREAADGLTVRASAEAAQMHAALTDLLAEHETVRAAREAADAQAAAMREVLELLLRVRSTGYTSSICEQFDSVFLREGLPGVARAIDAQALRAIDGDAGRTLLAERDALRACLEVAERCVDALRTLAAGCGDRLMANGPLADGYARNVAKTARDALLAYDEVHRG